MTELPLLCHYSEWHHIFHLKWIAVPCLLFLVIWTKLFLYLEHKYLLNCSFHTHYTFIILPFAFTTTFLWPFVRDYPVSRYQKKCSPTHTYPDHQSSCICFFHLLQSMASYLFRQHAWQSFCTISIPSFLWYSSWSGTLHFILHTFLHPIIVFFFAAHAHTIATCFAVVPKLYHLILVSLSTLYLELYCLV